MVFQIKQDNRFQNTHVKKKWLPSIASVLFVATSTAYALEPIVNISQTPLELTPTVASNVMILLDDSGSMDFEVMTTDVVSGGLFFSPNPDGSDFGSTDPDKLITQREGCELTTAGFGGYAYGIDATTNVYQDDSGNHCYVADAKAWRFRCPEFNTLYYNPSNDYKPWAGFRDDGIEFKNINIDPTAAPLNPFLESSPTINLVTPSEETGIDKFRLYLCGRDENGRFVNLSGIEINGTSIGTEEEGIPIVDMQNFANWFTYHRSRHLRAKALLGEYVSIESGARLGLAQFNSTNNLRVEEMNASVIDEGAKRSLLNTIYSSSPSNVFSIADSGAIEESPLAERYQETQDYLACGNSDIVFQANGLGLACPAEQSPAGTCQANHIIVASDGFYDRITAVGNNDTNGPGIFDGGDFADDFSNTFADLTIEFYEDDLQPGLPDEVVPETVDKNFADLDEDDRLHQHIKTHIVTARASLSPETEAAAETPPWEANPRRSDLGLLEDLVHAAFNARGRYLNTADNNLSNTSSVNAAAQNLAQSISTGVGSTTPVAINTQAITANVVLYRTFFDSFSNSGDLVAQEIIVNSDGSLNVDSDATPEFLWSAAEQLDELIEDNGSSNSLRNILTFSNITNDGIEFEFDDLDASQQALLQDPQPGSIANIAQDRLSYLRGGLTEREGTNFKLGEFRIRPETDSTAGTNANGEQVMHHSKLGTIANAAPVFVGQPQAVGRFGGAWPNGDGETYFDFQNSQAGRDASVLVAANDGMFHVFNAASGNERFAYIPSFVFENLSQLTLPEYKHQFFVDSTPSVEDAYIRANGGSLSWNTIVVGGLGAGGRGYYALNITDPDPEDNPANQVLWEFGPEDDPDASADGAISDLGLSYGRPLIAMTNANDGGEQRWVAVFGNGYNSTSPEGEAIIYLLFIDRGIDGSWEQTGDLVKINTGVEGEDTPNGISEVRAIDIDGNGTIDRLYAGDLRGNLHVVDIRSATSSNWALNSNRFILFKAKAPITNDPQPITTRPIVVDNQNGAGVIVVFSTGSYFTESDAIDESIQSIYGVFDVTALAGSSETAIGTEVDINDLNEQTLVNNLFEDIDAGISLEVRTINTSIPDVNDQGWVINFDVIERGGADIEFPGEKAVRELQLRNDILFVNTVIPQELNCNPAPGGFSLAIDPQDGSAGDQVIFDINVDNVFDEQDNISVLGNAGIIVGTRFDSTPTDATFFGDYRITQLSNTDIVSFKTNPANLELVGRQAWREVEF